MQKRSKVVRLSLMGLTPFVMAACSVNSSQSPSNASKPAAATPTIYETVDVCAQDGNPLQDCKKAFDAAQKQASLDAPRFLTEVDCKAEFKFCESKEAEIAAAAAAAPAVATTASSGEVAPTAAAPAPQQAGGGSFAPMMMGFMMGSMSNNSGGGAGAGFASTKNDRRGAGIAPVYRSAIGSGYATASSSSGGKTVQLNNVKAVTKANVNTHLAEKSRAASAAKTKTATSARASRSAGFSSRSSGG